MGMYLGMRVDQITMTAWGKRISSVWSEPEDDTAARAEVFFSIGSKEFPLRRSYYGLVGQEVKMRVESRPGDSSDEVEEFPRQRPRPLMSLFQALGLQSAIRFHPGHMMLRGRFQDQDVQSQEDEASEE